MTHTSRSVKRRVKRRASKSVKRKLRQISKKRMNLRKMRGGKNPDDFFSIYNVTTPIDTESKIWVDGRLQKRTTKEMNSVGMLFYNHKNGHFRLFLKYNEPNLIHGLCGIDIKDMEDRRFGSMGWSYYYIFEGKKLYTVTMDKSGFYTELQWSKNEIRQLPSKSGTKLQNQEEQTVSIDGTDFTFAKIVPDNEAKDNYQGSTSMFSTQDTVKSYFDQMRKVETKISSERQLANEKKHKKEQEEREKREKEEKEAAELAAAAEAEAALKAAQDAPICNELESKFGSLEKALVEIENIKKFWETQNIHKVSTAESCAEEWKKTQTAEKIAEIDALIGELYDITEMIKTNKDLCWEHFKTIRLNRKLFPAVLFELDKITKNKNDKTSLGVFQRLANEQEVSIREAQRDEWLLSR